MQDNKSKTSAETHLQTTSWKRKNAFSITIKTLALGLGLSSLILFGGGIIAFATVALATTILVSAVGKALVDRHVEKRDKIQNTNQEKSDKDLSKSKRIAKGDKVNNIFRGILQIAKFGLGIALLFVAPPVGVAAISLFAGEMILKGIGAKSGISEFFNSNKREQAIQTPVKEISRKSHEIKSEESKTNTLSKDKETDKIVDVRKIVHLVKSKEVASAARGLQGQPTSADLKRSESVVSDKGQTMGKYK